MTCLQVGECMATNIEQAVLEQMERAAVRRVMEDEERKNYDMRHPYWREELRDYMEKRGVQKQQPLDTESTGKE